jgi:CheY-like chemotaxis protein
VTTQDIRDDERPRRPSSGDGQGRAGEAETDARLRGEVLTEVAHEIRTPLNGIIGMVALMLDGPLEPVQRQRAETVYNSAEALLRILNDVLDAAKLDAGRLEIAETDFDLAEVVEDAVELMSGRARDRNIDLGVYLEPGLRTMVRGDPHRLRQVLLNLIGNAIKFTESGAVAVEVKTQATDEAQTTVRFDVIDTGIGVPADFVPRLFQKFSQADQSVARRFGGTGLGLSISQRLVELMGGAIGVESAVGLGSDFWFTLRFPKSALTAQTAATLPVALQGLRALVVDAVESDRRITARLLEALGLRVACAEDGFAAAADIERRWHQDAPYDLLVVDQSMPGMASEALAERIRADERFAAMRIAMVASPSGSLGAAGAVDIVISKPIRLRVLAESLSRLFEEKPAAAPALPRPGPQLDVAPPPAPLGLGPAASEAASAGKRVLLAEDNDVNQQVASALLRRAGFVVDIVTDGLQAVEAARNRRYDLILMDAHMPGLDGTEATERIRALGEPNGTVPIVALTANAMAGAREKYLSLGMNDYLAKPFRLNQLLEIARRWTEDVP